MIAMEYKVMENKAFDIKSMTLPEVRQVVEAMGEKPFRAKQLYEWMHVKLARSYDEMTNLPKNLQEQLRKQYPYISLREETVQTSKLDGTKKYLFALADGNYRECLDAVPSWKFCVYLLSGGVPYGVPVLCLDA